MMPQNISFATGIKSMARSSHVDCAPWAFGTSLPHRLHLGRMALPNGGSDRSGASAWTTLLFWARHICVGFCNPMPITTTPSERIGLCTRMRRFLVRFIRPESFVHTRSSEGFTITTSEFKFSVHTGLGDRGGGVAADAESESVSCLSPCYAGPI